MTHRPLYDLLLRDAEALDARLLDDDALSPALTGLLVLSLIGMAIYGLAVGLVATFPGGTFPVVGRPFLWAPLGLVAGLTGALAICLPSFYFYTQLAGIDASFRLVTAHAVRVHARSSVLLLAALPVFVAVALGNYLAPQMSMIWVLAIGFVMPFFVGLSGMASLYRSFRRLTKTLPLTHPRRGDFVLRVVFCWSVVFGAVAPLAVWRITASLAEVL